jgi:LemA protein
MKASWILGGIVAIVVLTLWGGYNGLVSKDTSVTAAMSQIQNQEQRRGDLIPNLVETVQGYAAHEKGVFKEVTEARAQVGKIALNVDVEKLVSDPALQKQLLDAQQNLTGALSRLIAVSENYPQLKANENFLALQSQLEGSENRIAVARGDYINAVRAYNASIRKFPTVIIANGLGFEKKPELEVPAEKRQLPTVDFSQKG